MLLSRRNKYGALIFLFILGIILSGIIYHSKNQKLQVVFLNVGQGDAILISKGSRQILIDGGPSGQIILEKIGDYVPFWDRRIDILITTHPDQDHIGGLPDIMRSYEIGKIIESGAKSDSQIFKAYEKMIEDEKIEKIIASFGMNIKLAKEIELEVMSPSELTQKCAKDTNSQSVVIKLVYGVSSFLFTGDLPGECEKIISATSLDMDVDFLKVAHHGSKSSTTGEFLAKTTPKEAIISVGKNNRYGHPTGEVLERLRKTGVNIFRTDESRDIVYICENSKEECMIRR